MLQSQKVAAPLTSCSLQPRLFQKSAQCLRKEGTHIFGLLALALLVIGGLTGCKDRIVVKPLNVAQEYPDKFECEKGVEGGRPALPLEETGNFESYKESVRARELLVAGYILALEAVNFKCWDNMQWQKDFYSKIPK